MFLKNVCFLHRVFITKWLLISFLNMSFNEHSFFYSQQLISKVHMRASYFRLITIRLSLLLYACSVCHLPQNVFTLHTLVHSATDDIMYFSLPYLYMSLLEKFSEYKSAGSSAKFDVNNVAQRYGEEMCVLVETITYEVAIRSHMKFLDD